MDVMSKYVGNCESFSFNITGQNGLYLVFPCRLTFQVNVFKGVVRILIGG